MCSVLGVLSAVLGGAIVLGLTPIQMTLMIWVVAGRDTVEATASGCSERAWLGSALVRFLREQFWAEVVVTTCCRRRGSGVVGLERVVRSERDGWLAVMGRPASVILAVACVLVFLPWLVWLGSWSCSCARRDLLG